MGIRLKISNAYLTGGASLKKKRRQEKEYANAIRRSSHGYLLCFTKLARILHRFGYGCYVFLMIRAWQWIFGGNQKKTTGSGSAGASGFLHYKAALERGREPPLRSEG
jgi:hypothetical protein